MFVFATSVLAWVGATALGWGDLLSNYPVGGCTLALASESELEFAFAVRAITVLAALVMTASGSACLALRTRRVPCAAAGLGVAVLTYSQLQLWLQAGLAGRPPIWVWVSPAVAFGPTEFSSMLGCAFWLVAWVWCSAGLSLLTRKV
jgi:hypothetical protein